MDEITSNTKVSFIKSEDKRLVTGVVFIPDVPDYQGDVISKEEIESAAHNYMIKSRLSDLQHEVILDNSQVVPVESFIAPHDIIINGELIPDGSWVMTVKVFDDEIWGLVKSGELNGFSITGVGRRIARD